ncbi:MAG TPA: D-2-hydroxyacid dehydrogenase [Bryobacteraceae bacterium]|nr:D-2-hydroxyacid dehydrogenase [Bryobacteraceae bacterium]
MSDEFLSRQFFLSAAAPQADRVAAFEPAPERARIATVPGPATTFTPAEVEQILSQSPKIELNQTQTMEDFQRLLPQVDVVIGAVNADMLARAKNLRWMQHTEAGVDTVLFPELVESPVVVTNMARMFGPCISETAVGMLLALTRGLNRYYIPQFGQRKWFADRNLVEVDGMTMGIVGMGGLGCATAERFHYGFHMRILATDAKPLVKPMYVDTLREPAWLMEMVPQVDVLVSAAPLTKHTALLFNEQVFRAMKKTAYFLSLSRGGLVDQPALEQALKEGWIAGAGLDVTTPEPLAPDAPLWDCPNTVMTCHTSGFAPQRRIRQMSLIAENVRRYAAGLPLLNVVDKARGY